MQFFFTQVLSYKVKEKEEMFRAYLKEIQQQSQYSCAISINLKIFMLGTYLLLVCSTQTLHADV